MAAINTQKPLQSQIRDLATDELGKHAGMVVGILRGGDQWVAGYGSLDVDKQSPCEDAIFEIGSITKVFTTLALAEMVLRGEVALDDPAQTYLPGNVRLPRWRDQEITLLHLATHTSSLPRLPANLWKTIKDPANPYANYRVSDLYEFLSGYRLKRPIGSRVEYSNLGMGLLGHILGLVAGKSYEELVNERILRPLGMNDTAITLSLSQQERLAPGHTSEGKVTANWDLPTLAGCGALRSTARDVLRFTAASMNHSTSPLAKAVSLCQRLYPRTINDRLSWNDFMLAMLFSGLGILAQWLFGLTPRDPYPFFVLAVYWPIILAAKHGGLVPGLLATAVTVAGTYLLHQGQNFSWWRNLLGGGAVSLFEWCFLRWRDRGPMLGWQYQRLFLFPFPRGPRFVWHNGGTGGYASFVGFIREREVAVVVLANAEKSVDSVGVKILKLLNREMSPNGDIGRVSSETQQGEGKQS